MGIEVERMKLVRADPEVVWDLLVRPQSWASWWPGCVSARLDEDRDLREGSRLELVLQPRRMRLTLRPMVDLMTDRKTLSLTHRSGLIQSTAAWYLVEKPDATQVKAELVCNGLLPFLVTVVQQADAVRGTLDSNLRGLKRAAERMV